LRHDRDGGDQKAVQPFEVEHGAGFRDDHAEQD